MPENFVKLVVTAVMWVFCAAISIMALIFGNNTLSGDLTAMVVVPLIIALIGTFFIWVAPELARVETLKAQGSAAESEKAKRRGAGRGDARLSLLLELMDEDERAAFKETLKRRLLDSARIDEDGELPLDVESLFTDQSGEQQRR